MKEVLFSIHEVYRYQINFHKDIEKLMQKPNIRVIVSFNVYGRADQNFVYIDKLVPFFDLPIDEEQ